MMNKIINTNFLCLLLFSLFIGQVYSETIIEPPSNYKKIFAGTKINPYLISSLGNLRWLSENPNVWGKKFFIPFTERSFYIKRYHFTQTADIDATDTAGWNGGNGFTPIGYQERYSVPYYHTFEKYFCGVYDGNGFSITNLFIKHRSGYLTDDINIKEYRGSPIGLFASVRYSTIKNVKLINVNMTGFRETGALVGSAFKSRILNSSTSGELFGSEASFMGGIVGTTHNKNLIQYCHSSVNLKSESFAIFGGLVSLLGYKSSIKDSYFNGSLDFNGDSYGGGIVGSGLSYHSKMKQKYRANIENVYVVGRSPFSNSYGIIGEAEQMIINGVFWDTESTGVAEPSRKICDNTTINNIKGLTTQSMRQMETFQDAGWDFNKIWSIDPQMNNGYPYLANNTKLTI